MTDSTEHDAYRMQVEGTSEQGDVHVDKPFETDGYGWKVMLQGLDRSDNDVVKDLPWDITHRKYDNDVGCWTVDLESLDVVLVHFTMGGYKVTFSKEVQESYQEEIMDNTVVDLPWRG